MKINTKQMESNLRMAEFRLAIWTLIETSIELSEYEILGVLNEVSSAIIRQNVRDEVKNGWTEDAPLDTHVVYESGQYILEKTGDRILCRAIELRELGLVEIYDLAMSEEEVCYSAEASPHIIYFFGEERV